MDLDKRIEILEAQVRELAELVRALRPEKEASQEPAPDGDRSGSAAEEMAKRNPRQDGGFREDVSRNVDRVLGGEPGEDLETRIGGIWLSRIAVVLFMTACVIGARITLFTDVLGPWQKVILAYGVAVIAIAYGSLHWRSRDLFPKTILGMGLAAVYFTTYAMFFTEGLQIFTSKTLALPLLLVCLLLLVAVSHLRRSQTVAGISLFLVYYTVAASCTGGKDAEHIAYALATCAVLAAVTLAFHAAHRWLLFTWAALIATHVTYIFYFLAKPAGLAMPDTQYFWLSNGFLTICYVLFSVACIVDARKTGEYRRTVASMAGVNSCIYFTLTWIAIRQQYVEHEWAFRLAFAGLLLVFAIFAETTGPRRNYLFQIFIAKVVIMFTLALQAYLSGEMLMVAMAIECLALAFSYKRSGIVMFKILGLGLLLITFVGCLFHVRDTGVLGIWEIEVPANWFCCAGSAIVLAVVAWFYEQFVSRTKPEDRVVSGQWFLADTFLDVPSATTSILYAAASAITLLTVTIIALGDSPALPYTLAAESVLMVAAGFVLRTPQVEVASVLLLGASHLCYHAFVWMGHPGFREQDQYALYTVLVAMFTYFGAHLWERYLHRLQGGDQWEHDVIAAIPYLAATFMLTTLIGHELAPVFAPVAQNALGVGLLLIGSLTFYTGIKASGVLALSIGTATFYNGLYDVQAPFAREPLFLIHLGALLLTYIAAERLFHALQREERAPSRAEDILRTTLVAIAAVLGVLSLQIYSESGHLTFYWLAIAVAGFAFGAVFRESRYRWAAMLLFALVIFRAFLFDLRELPHIYQFLSFATLSAALLIISWAYSRYRQRALKRAAENAQQTPSEE